MITRFAMFEGSVATGQTTAFRAAVRDHLIPRWAQFSGNTEVRVMFSDDRDEGAPEFPLILAISYPDAETMDAALALPARYESKEITGQIVNAFFHGRIHHHVTERHEFVS